MSVGGHHRKGSRACANEFGSFYRVDFNVFLQGARPSLFGETNSVVDAFAVGLRRENSASGITLFFQMNDAPFRVHAPVVGAELVGVFPRVDQTLGDREGRPITVNTDLLGRPFDRRLPGTLATVQLSENRISWLRSPAPPVKGQE